MATKRHFNIAHYCERMEAYLGNQEGESKLFWQALSYAVAAHQDQKRKSGEAYVSHPCRVAMILVEEMGVRDPETLAAAMLHDTIEDVPEVTPEVIRELFGANIEAIVDGCTKITHFTGDRQTFYKLVHRKLFSGAASRVEVMLIKLADRLHNLRTMISMPKHKRQKIAEETLDIYAPMAKVMGLYGIKRELYDLALMYKFPRQSNKVLANIRTLATNPEALKVQQTLQEKMRQAGIQCTITIRAKGLWAYYDPAQKILDREIKNPLEFIVAVDAVQSCYQALGVINQTYPPIPRTIRDFIANPKPTGYQCLHARANIRGDNYFFKIKTNDMHDSAQSGIVKEWSQHRKIPSSFEKEIREMLGILGTEEGVSYRDMIAASGKKEIYTYTPKGDLLCLPKNSRVLDFAFKVHTELGRHCTGAFINRKRVGSDHILQDGDQVRIISQKGLVRFDPQIQESCQSPKARHELARMFRWRRRTLAREIGKSIVRQEMKRYGIPFEVLEKPEMTAILDHFEQDSLGELFQHVGQDLLRLRELIEEIKQRLYADRLTLQAPTGFLNQLHLDNLDPACIKLSRCCNPLPTDKGLFGLLSERGLSVHHKECRTFQNLQVQREDVVELRWELKKTPLRKEQTLVILGVTRNRLLMLLGVAPDEMRIGEIISLSPQAARGSDWEVTFRTDNLLCLRHILHHFNKSGLNYEFVLDQ